VVAPEAEAKLESLAKVAVTTYEPTARLLTGQEAVRVAPLTRLTEVQFGSVIGEPFKVAVKLTEPVGTIPLFGVTVAVRITAVSTGTEALELLTDTTGVAVVMVCVVEFEAEVKLVSATRVAVTV